MTRRVQLTHVPALDGLRGLAVVAVVLFHAGHWRGGYLGVDLFFVLSGFLITMLLLAEADQRGSVRLGGFWARRARRLLPAIGGLMVGVALYSAVVAQPGELAQIRGDALATIGYFANWRAVFAGQDYWALFRAPSPLNHTWSLAIEEQFYLVWPLVIVGLLAWWRHALARAVLVVAIGFGVMSAVLMWSWYDGADPSRVYFGTDTRASGILWGVGLAAVIAIWGPVQSRAGRRVLELSGLVGLVTLLGLWSSLDGRSSRLYHGGFLVAEIAAVAVIAAAVHPQRRGLARVLSWRPIIGLGLISYGVYLWHWPVDVALTESRLGVGGWPLVAVQVACTLLIALGSYWIIEMPVRRGAGTARQWLIATPLLLGAVVFTMVMTTTGATGPPGSVAVEQRLDRAIVRARTAPKGSRRVVVVGDSVGWFLGDAMAGLKTNPPEVVANLSLLACVFPSGASVVTYTATGESRPNPPACNSKLDTALRKFRPDYVVMFGWAEGKVRYEFAGRTLRPCDPGFRARYRRQLTDVARRVQRHGARMVISTYPMTADDADSPSARRAVGCVNADRRTLAAQTGAQLVDLAAFICPPGRACTTQAFGIPLRPDGVHFTGPAATGMARWVLDQIKPAA